MPAVTATGCGTPSRSTQTWRAPALGPTWRAVRVPVRGGRGISFDTMPPPGDAASPAAALPAAAGVKRSAVFGTSNTSLRSTATIVAVAVIPGRRLRSVLSTSSRVA